MAKFAPPPLSTPSYDPVDAGFLDARGKLIDVAAFLDRVERRGRADDYRVVALKKSLGKLSSPDAPAERAASVLRSLSDPTSLAVAKAGTPAAGAPVPPKRKLSSVQKKPRH